MAPPPARRSRAAQREPTRRGLVVVANRLPVHRVGHGEHARWEPSAGGLVTALSPILKQTGGAWVGWVGVGDKAIRPFTHDSIRVRPVKITRSEVETYYHGFSNRTLWPLYHDAIRTPEFDHSWWEPHVRVNERFARAAALAARRGDLIWVHDYHLQLAPAMIRKLRPRARIGFFLHIPFPPEELFEWLPWRQEILEGLLGADVIGFQTEIAAQNFSRLCRKFTDAEGTDHELEYRGRRITVQSYPISIDFNWFDERAAQPETASRANEIRQRLGPRRKMLLAVDRLDYTKGIDHRMRAFEMLLDQPGFSVENCVLVQVAAPSREVVDEYADMRSRIELTVGRINGEHSVPGRVAVHYFRRNIPREDLVAYYRAADVMLVTPLRDGMNLVAKEYVASRPDLGGVLVLSEFAGAARELRRALLVNPRDTEQMTATFKEALSMRRTDARQRMAILRTMVRRHDVFEWSRAFLTDLARSTP